MPMRNNGWVTTCRLDLLPVRKNALSAGDKPLMSVGDGFDGMQSVVPKGLPVAFVFDLDGTLLNTLPDLTAITNRVLETHGYPRRTIEEIRSFIGDGAKLLIRRSFPQSASDEECAVALAEWKAGYAEHDQGLTQPYEGIPEVLAELRENGCKLGVLSNKFDAAVKQLVGCYFLETFDIAQGESPDCPPKPNPQGLKGLIADLGMLPGQTIYVGDSAGDMKVAKAAGAMAIGVSWGYQPVKSLGLAGADMIIDDPHQLVRFV